MKDKEISCQQTLKEYNSQMQDMKISYQRTIDDFKNRELSYQRTIEDCNSQLQVMKDKENNYLQTIEDYKKLLNRPGADHFAHKTRVCEGVLKQSEEENEKLKQQLNNCDNNCYRNVFGT